MLSQKTINYLQNKKNLLAFSAGIDSTALFFLLQQHNINFDIAIVDYGVREQSKQEVAYAQELTQKYNKKCFLHKAQKITQNFEATARTIRYDFFEKVIKEHNYTTLLTAHHLGDKLEWFLMQFTKGAGVAELNGMQEFQQQKNYTLVRPLLQYDKQELLEYLHVNNIRYFLDKSNFSTKYKRNYFRKEFSEKLLKEYKEGIKKSFTYLQEDAKELTYSVEYKEIEDMCYFPSFTPRGDLINIDTYLKKKSYLLSKSEKETLKKQENTIVGRKYLIVFANQYIFITPYTQTNITMNKKFKEECRILHIEPKLRPFFYQKKKAFVLFKTLMPKA